MNAFKIETTTDPRKLTQSVIQIIDILDMYQAELARVLKVQCSDIGELSSAKRNLQADTEQWDQALLFVRLYQLLFIYCNAESAKMIHWMRKDSKELDHSPHVLIVDENQLGYVVECLETMADSSFNE